MHTCPVQQCEIEVKDEFYLCIKHWQLVPRSIRRSIWNATKKRDTNRLQYLAREATEVVKRKVKK